MTRRRRRRAGQVRPYLGPDGRALPGSVAEKWHVEVNGVLQGMVVKTRDLRHPVLLFVHGGPGLPEYFLQHDHPVGLDDDFTVVWWDQRGAGLSFDPHLPAETLNVEQFIADTLTVTDVLRERFDREKIFLLGHSWGSFIGIQAVQRAPEAFHAYIGMAQVVHQLRSEERAYQYVLQEYRRRGDRRMVRALEAAPVTMANGLPQGWRRLRDKAMHATGVGTMRAMHSVITGVFLPSLRFPEYTAREKIALWRGKVLAKRSTLFDVALETDLRSTVPTLDVPVYFLEGAHDYTANYDLAREYFAALTAPVKGFYTFTSSAHSPVFEEPVKARHILRTDVLSGTTTLADAHADGG